MKNMNFDQKLRMFLWPLMIILFINTFGMIAYEASGLSLTLESYSSMALSFNIIFRVALLIISIVFGIFIYHHQHIRISKEFTKSGKYNMQGRGVVGFTVHVILGLIEAAFVFFTLNTFWIISNFGTDLSPLLTQWAVISGFCAIFLLSAYFLTRQTALGVLAYKHRR
jgi:hypothetical protein